MPPQGRLRASRFGVGGWATSRHLANRLLIVLAAVLVTACGTTAPKDKGPFFYPAPPDQPRFQYLGAFTGEEDLATQSGFEDFLLGEKPEVRGLRKPYGVAVQGPRFYVTDTVLKKIVVVDWDAKTFGELEGDGGPGKVDTPINITISADGHKWVTDVGRGQVLEYGPTDRFLRAIGTKGQFKPTDVAVTDKRLYVADVAGHKIHILDRRSGKLIKTAGSPGSGPGQFTFPTNIALDAAGNLYVSDTGNFRVQKLSPEGELLGSFGSVGDTPGSFTRPKGITVDPEGRIYVVDAAFENVQIFDPEFHLLMGLGGPGNEPGNLYLPSDVEIVTKDIGRFAKLADPRLKVEFLVVVVNQYGPRRVNIYGYGQWTEGAQGGGAAGTAETK